MKIFHRYTGVITFGITLSIIFLIWNYYEGEKVFFEDWSCNAILDLEIDDMTTKELLRHNEIIPNCDKFTPPK